ncbi:hypothetical protein [Spiroplasma endosymbiont of Virgichneumon dumeticola]|uniref:hypothetical protein n=1 Tax=Spiroplasma endosymbiont of Virgichneumon dumeticola TaxID=3139323 RepID=UPI0035C92B3B
MNNYLLSVDPSMKNTGFTLWEKNISKDWKKIQDNTPYEYWKPILISSCSFKKNSIDNFYRDMHYVIYGTLELKNELTNSKNNFDLIIERGTFHSKNGIGYETQDHLRGFIAGQFNKLLTKDMLISSSECRKWYKEKQELLLPIYTSYSKIKKWDKDFSIMFATSLIKKNNWNIEIKDHDQAESLLIGWYYFNKEVK